MRTSTGGGPTGSRLRYDLQRIWSSGAEDLWDTRYAHQGLHGTPGHRVCQGTWTWLRYFAQRPTAGASRRPQCACGRSTRLPPVLLQGPCAEKTSGLEQQANDSEASSRAPGKRNYSARARMGAVGVAPGAWPLPCGGGTSVEHTRLVSGWRPKPARGVEGRRDGSNYNLHMYC